jgi:hypothetical protein
MGATHLDAVQLAAGVGVAVLIDRQ